MRFVRTHMIGAGMNAFLKTLAAVAACLPEASALSAPGSSLSCRSCAAPLRTLPQHRLGIPPPSPGFAAARAPPDCVPVCACAVCECVCVFVCVCVWVGRGAWTERKASARHADAMRIRGGKDIPIDMRIFHWLEDRGGQCALCVFSLRPSLSLRFRARDDRCS